MWWFASLQAAIAPQSGIENVLSMFFRDDIMAWYQKRVAGRTPGVQPLRTAKLQQLVHTNVRDTIGRLHQVGQVTVPIAHHVSHDVRLDVQSFLPLGLCKCPHQVGTSETRGASRSAGS